MYTIQTSYRLPTTLLCLLHLLLQEEEDISRIVSSKIPYLIGGNTGYDFVYVCES